MKIKDGLWAGVALVALAYLLMGFVKEFLPILIVGFVVYVVIGVMFRRKW